MNDEETKELIHRTLELITKATSSLQAAHLILAYIQYPDSKLMKSGAELAIDATKDQ